MKTNVQVKDEPVELQVNELLRLYGYNISHSSTTRSTRTKAIPSQEQEPSTCAWCQKLGIRSFTLRTDDGELKSLCSEVCFNHYRRASFKKNKGSESDVDHHTLSAVTTNKNKPAQKKSASEKSEYSSLDINRRKILLPIRRSTPTVCKTKPNGIPRKISPSPSSKRHRSSSPSSSNEKVLHIDQTSLPVPPPNLPVSLAWQPSLFLPSSIPWAPPMDINRFQYPFFAPPPPPPAPVVSNASSSALFSTLTKGALSNYTCILPTFIPLPIPIPIPLCFPISLPCGKCSMEVTDQQCQTITEEDLHPKRTRRISV